MLLLTSCDLLSHLFLRFRSWVSNVMENELWQEGYEVLKFPDAVWKAAHHFWFACFSRVSHSSHMYNKISPHFFFVDKGQSQATQAIPGKKALTEC